MKASRTAREELDRYEFEYKLVNDMLTRCEHAARAILEELGCPTDLPTVYNILTGKQKQPGSWSRRTAASNKIRVLHAMHALAHVAAARRHILLGQDNSRMAAYEAFFAGLHAHHAAVAVTTRRNTRAGGSTRGAQLATTARCDDAAILKHWKRWAMSEELQEQYRSGAAYVEKKEPKLKRRRIERRLKALTKAKDCDSS